MERIRIQMLGGFILKTDKQKMDLIALLGKQTAAFLACLCLNHGTLVTKERLIELFWEDSKNPLNAMKFTDCGNIWRSCLWRARTSGL